MELVLCESRLEFVERRKSSLILDQTKGQTVRCTFPPF